MDEISSGFVRKGVKKWFADNPSRNSGQKPDPKKFPKRDFYVRISWIETRLCIILCRSSDSDTNQANHKASLLNLAEWLSRSQLAEGLVRTHTRSCFLRGTRGQENSSGHRVADRRISRAPISSKAKCFWRYLSIRRSIKRTQDNSEQSIL